VLVDLASQTSSEEIRERRILHGADDLPASAPNRGKHLSQMERAVVIYVLDRIIQH
jgi:hypothetical protein